MILHVLIAMLTGWINRHRQQVIAALQEQTVSSQSNLVAADCL